LPLSSPNCNPIPRFHLPFPQETFYIVLCLRKTAHIFFQTLGCVVWHNSVSLTYNILRVAADPITAHFPRYASSCYFATRILTWSRKDGNTFTFSAVWLEVWSSTVIHISGVARDCWPSCTRV